MPKVRVSKVGKAKNYVLEFPNEHFQSNGEILYCSASNLSLPPEPIITRWGTWLNAVTYYCENFEKIKDVVSTLDSTSAVSIQKAKHLLKDTIKQLETRKITLVQSLGLIEEAEKCIEQVQGPLGIAVKEKMHSVLHKNPGLDCLKLIRDTHCEMNGVIWPAELTAFDIANMKYAPVTSVEVECSFSRYKSVLRPNRRSFNFDNLSMYYCFQDQDQDE